MKTDDVREFIAKYHDAVKLRLLMEYGEKIVIPLHNVVSIKVVDNLLQIVYNSGESDDGLALVQYRCKDIEIMQVQY